MRILYLHQYFTTTDSAGGTRSYEFARRLISAGHEVLMITSSARLTQDYGSNLSYKPKELSGIPTIVIPVPYSNDMTYHSRIRAFISFALRASQETVHYKTDVIFATSTPLTIAIPAIIGRLWHGIPMVFEVRDLWPELPIAIGALHNPLAKAAAIALEWIAYHASTHVVALSPGMAAGIMRRGIPEDRITVIPNSCDVELFDIPPADGWHIRQQLGLHEGQPLVIYAGTFGKINGVGYLVDIAAATRALNPDVRFLLVGEGAEYEMVVEKAHTLGVIDENLWIWNSLPKSKMPELLAAATVATSLFIPLEPMWNNSANKFFDALAARKPIIINYGGWQAKLLIETRAGIVISPDNATQAANDIVALLADSERIRQAADAAHTLAETQFHRDIMAQKLEAVLRKSVEDLKR